MTEKNASLKELVVERFRGDRFAAHAGLEIIDVSPGYAKVEMKIKDYHLNSVNIVHGGAIFTLGDFACAVAGNCTEIASVAIEGNVSFLKPTPGGSLFAEAKEISRSKSLTGFEVAIKNDKDELVARYYGRSFIRRERS